MAQAHTMTSAAAPYHSMTSMSDAELKSSKDTNSHDGCQCWGLRQGLLRLMTTKLQCCCVWYCMQYQHQYAACCWQPCQTVDGAAQPNTSASKAGNTMQPQANSPQAKPSGANKAAAAHHNHHNLSGTKEAAKTPPEKLQGAAVNHLVR